MPDLLDCSNAAPSAPRSNYTNFASQLLYLNVTGDQVATAAPLMLLSPQASGIFTFPYQSAVFNITFTSTILNPTSDLVAVHLIANQGEPQFNMAGSVTSFVHHLTWQNSAIGSFGPSNRTTVLPFGTIDAINFFGGQSISVYVTAPNDASVEIAVAASIFYTYNLGNV